MLKPPLPPWFKRACDLSARFASPLGKPFAAAKEKKVGLLYLYDAIGVDFWTGEGVTPQKVVEALAEMEDVDSLDVHVNSPGGLVFDGIAIYNAIRAFAKPKTVYVDGLAASIASVISLAGDKVVTNEGATWMIHEPMGDIFSWGTADQIEAATAKEAKALRKIRENILGIYVTNTGQGLPKLSEWMAAETWMTPEEALQRGFTDEISKTEEPAKEAALSPRAAADLARARMRARTGVAEDARLLELLRRSEQLGRELARRR